MEHLPIDHTTLTVPDFQDLVDLEGDYMEVVMDETDMATDGLDCDNPMDANSDTGDSECNYPMDADPGMEETEEYYDTVEQPEKEMDVVQDETVVQMDDLGVSENRWLGMESRELLPLGAMIGMLALLMMMNWGASKE